MAVADWHSPFQGRSRCHDRTYMPPILSLTGVVSSQTHEFLTRTSLPLRKVTSRHNKPDIDVRGEASNSS